MADYNYIEGKKRIIDILESQNETTQSDSIPLESAFSYDNGYYGYVTAVFVDIRNSLKLFNNDSIRKTTRAKIIRSFTSEVIEILRKNENLRDIGIRGDCVFAIYTTPNYQDDYEVFDAVVYVNTFRKMLNSLLKKKGLEPIEFGIGVATGNDLVVKAGRNGTGINDLIWIGKAVTYASRFSSFANKNGNSPIIVSDLFFENLSKAISKSNIYQNKLEWFSNFRYDGFEGKQCDIIKTKMNEWILNGMKDE